ncbi:MAG: hypothetical protein NUV50_03390 [Rhodospirillales bacterium]|nr:hypothetical protein [Rhodospirillales bacterium]
MAREKKHLPYRQEDGVKLIEIRLHKVQQLFSSLDPAPFRERDLDPAAEAYMVSGVQDFPLKRQMKIVIHLPEPELATLDIANVPQAVRNYFAYRMATTQADLKALLNNGWITLLIALAFMGSCLILLQMVQTTLTGTVGDIVKEGLQIMAWVSMWRPIQTFLYDWWPLLGKIRIFAKLRDMEVELRQLPL